MAPDRSPQVAGFRGDPDRPEATGCPAFTSRSALQPYIRQTSPQIGFYGGRWCNHNTYMHFLPRPLLFGLTGLACAFASRSALAWVETSVLSDAVTVDVDQSGQAIVSHDLWMKIRGGPLKGTELDGVDSDAEPLADAQVARITTGAASEKTKPLLLSRGDDDSLHIEVEDNVGLRNGTYAFRFRYRTDLRHKSRVGLRGSWAELAWVGPRYRAGLDVAKVTFRLPYAPTAPRLPEIDPGVDGLAQGELPTSAMLSTLRRGADIDDLELVRPHVAKGEPVLWRIWAAPASFPWLTEPKRGIAGVSAPAIATPRSPLGKGIPLVLAAVLAAASAVIVLFKHRATTRMAARQNCTPRPLIAMGPYLRAAITGLLLGMALLLSVRFDAPTAGAVALLLAEACMIYRRPVWPRQLRGPGRWLPVHQQEAFHRDTACQFGRFLDASTSRGQCVLGVWVIGTLMVGSWLFRTQPYLALLTFMATVIPWPLLMTGRASELPLHRRNRARQDLDWMHRQLSRNQRLRVHPVGRFAEGESTPDEIRLKVTATTMPEGLIGLEIVSHAVNDLGQPCLLIRIRDASPAHQQYRAAWSFVRGRTADERVAVFAPSLGARARILEQVAAILASDAATPAGHGASTTRSIRSSGGVSSTSKPSRSSVPDQATRAA
jgi:hypothetical protein